MPDLDVGDLKRLAFPQGMRERYTTLAWESQRRYFMLMVAGGALCWLIGWLI